MNKQELVSAVSEKLNKDKKVKISKKDMIEIVDTLFDVVQGELKKGEKIQLVGFGTFGVKTRQGRRGRNPQTGKEIQIPSTNVPFFRPGKVLKDTVK
ncbi:MAG: HU family DNA-binding protein [Atribacterota bacterium]|nr:HU family DNA-binding protein [Candidatus Atribacteria bacterium]